MSFDHNRHGPRRITGERFHARVHGLVRTVPPGFVTTYGDVARALGCPSVARHVGFAMAALPAGSDVPWWRVVAAGGRISLAGAGAARQAKMLRSEGHVVRGSRVTKFDDCRLPLARPVGGEGASGVTP